MFFSFNIWVYIKYENEFHRSIETTKLRGWSDRSVSNDSFLSVTLNELGMKARETILELTVDSKIDTKRS